MPPREPYVRQLLADLLTFDEAAAEAKVTTRTLRRWSKIGALKVYYGPGRKPFIYGPELRALFLAGCGVLAPPRHPGRPRKAQPAA
jgi:hypothetical protein